MPRSLEACAVIVDTVQRAYTEPNTDTMFSRLVALSQRVGDAVCSISTHTRRHVPACMTGVALGIIPARQPATQVTLRGRQLEPERLVAEAAIGEHVYLPVMLHGRVATLLLDLGTNDYLLLSRSALASLGMPVSASVDSLRIGTSIARHVPARDPGINWGAAPPGWPPLVGLAGTRMLAHYDLLFNGPDRRVSLYVPRQVVPHTPRQPAWLPTGLAPADCMPMTVERSTSDHYVSFGLEANGHQIPAFFDSGARETTMNIPAARLLGIRESDPRMHLLPDDSTKTYPNVEMQKEYAVAGITLSAAGRSFPISPLFVLEYVPSPDPTQPEMNVGTDAFRDRLLWISYSTRQICWSEPVPVRTPGT